MERKSEVIETLNDLILINNDRIAGYEKSYEETDNIETDLKGLFQKYINDSRGFISQLTDEVIKLGGQPADGTLFSGKLYRVWMNIRATFSSDNRKAVLENSEAGEDAAQEAYAEALKAEELPADLQQLILSQKTILKEAHDNIKSQRDQQRDVWNYPLTT
ncbi:PA2169 family four-helix-bundle protein [Dyadobacter sp. NIV53]|uniref:ferritin-like domain-containing protein n=1 Tax=Dyadobacter sp. NIV53 TaxID=2861765 RepID=UPI001C86A980|nr:PA2169 family four-helix-bundle protein [Dyadobacter sp. NIV53]